MSIKLNSDKSAFMKDFIIIRSLFDQRKRLLSIHKDSIRFENKDNIQDLYTILPRENISGIRYGIRFIKGIKFYIGREYLIFIKDYSGRELKINFKIFYGRKLEQKNKLFNEIVNELWVNFFDEKVNSYYLKLKQNESFILADIHFKIDCIEFSKYKISYDDLSVKTYYHYFVIFSLNNQNINKLLYYLNDDDSVLVLALINKIKKNILL